MRAIENAQLDAVRCRGALLHERGSDLNALFGCASAAGLWMPFQATPSLYQALSRRYSNGDALRASASEESIQVYYFDFLSRVVSLSLPSGSVVVPMPPSDASMQAMVRLFMPACACMRVHAGMCACTCTYGLEYFLLKCVAIGASFCTVLSGAVRGRWWCRE